MDEKKVLKKIMPVSKRLIKLIENDAEKLAEKWLADIKTRFKTPTYHTFDEKELFHSAYKVYRNLGKWISWETTKEQIAAVYTAHGARRREQNFELAEVVQALILMRRHLWQKVLDDGLLDTALDMYQAMELNRQVVRYFDRAIYFTIVGYMQNR
jgi:hypothetical protein